MLRIFFLFILLLHGLIHLMGFAKAFKYVEISQLTSHISKTAGVLWLSAALLFIASAVLFFLKKETWWMIGIPAVLLSQMLIFSQWHDAKFGTIANVIALLGIVPAFGLWNFNAMVRNELEAFLPKEIPTETVLTRDMLTSLPPVVQKWLERSGAVGKPLVHTAHIRQKGDMLTKPGGTWMPFEAEQWNTVDRPGFIWRTTMQAAPDIDIVGRDKYVDGHGNMLIKLLALVPIADAKGPETDQGSLLRNLGEICWIPSAALRDYIRWEQPDSLSAKATMTHGGITASGVFRFDAAGDLISFEARRYYDRKEGATLENWLVRNTGYGEFEGIRMPVKSEVTWKLAGGDYTWLKLEIVEVEYNRR